MCFYNNQKALFCKELLLTFALFVLPGVIYTPHVLGTEYNHPQFLISVIVTGLAQTGLLLYLLSHIGGRLLTDYNIVPFRLKNVLWAALSCILIFPVLFLAGFLMYYTLYLTDGDIQSIMPPFRWSYTNYSLLPLTFLACLATGYMEELYYRAYLPVELFRLGMPAAPAMLIPIFLFASGHFYQGITGAIASCIMGFYLTFVFRTAKNLHVPAIAHGFYNFCVLLLSVLDFHEFEELLSLPRRVL